MTDQADPSPGAGSLRAAAVAARSARENHASRGFGKPFRVGIVGTGFMGRVHSLASRRAGAEVTALASSSPERARAVADDWQVGDVYTSAEDLITSGNVDIVHICTPNHLHARLSQLALSNDVHVVCEKPIGMDAAEAGRLAEAARASRATAAVPFIYRYYPALREARARVARGDAGSLHLLHGAYLQDWMSDPDDADWRVDPDKGGRSRAFADIGIHWCDAVEFVSGHRIVELVATTAAPVDRPSPNGSHSPQEHATEDVAAILFRTDQGATGSLMSSQVSLGRKNRLVLSIDGASAAYYFNQEAPDSLWIGRRDDVVTLPRGTATMSPAAQAYSVLPAGHPQGYQDCFDAFVADAYAAARGGAPDGLPSFDDGLRAALIVEAVLRSATTGQWTEVEV